MERNKAHLRYDICLAMGYPIGSGIVDGACRNLINDRMELTEMRWSLNGAQAMKKSGLLTSMETGKTFGNSAGKRKTTDCYPWDPANSLEIHDIELKRRRFVFRFRRYTTRSLVEFCVHRIIMPFLFHFQFT
jgi:hypothetical protein